MNSSWSCSSTGVLRSGETPYAGMPAERRKRESTPVILYEGHAGGCGKDFWEESDTALRTHSTQQLPPRVAVVDGRDGRVDAFDDVLEARAVLGHQPLEERRDVREAGAWRHADVDGYALQSGSWGHAGLGVLGHDVLLHAALRHGSVMSGVP